MNQDFTDTFLTAIERVLRTFIFERFAYLLCTVIGFATLIYSVITAIGTGELKQEQLGAIFGSTGVVTVASGGVLYMFKRAFSLVEDVIRFQLGMARSNPGVEQRQAGAEEAPHD